MMTTTAMMVKVYLLLWAVGEFVTNRTTSCGLLCRVLNLAQSLRKV